MRSTCDLGRCERPPRRSDTAENIVRLCGDEPREERNTDRDGRHHRDRQPGPRGASKRKHYYAGNDEPGKF